MADKTSDVAAGDTILATQYNNLREEVLAPRLPMNRIPCTLSFAGVNGGSDGLGLGTTGTVSGLDYSGDTISFSLAANVAGQLNAYVSQGIATYVLFNELWEMTIISQPRDTSDDALTQFSGLVAYADLGDIPIGSSNHFVGIRSNNAGVHCVNGNGTSETSTTFAPANAGRVLNNCTIKYNGTNLKFYNNGVLIATHTTNLPTAGNPIPYHVINSTGAGSATSVGFFLGPIYLEEIVGA